MQAIPLPSPVHLPDKLAELEDIRRSWAGRSKAGMSMLYLAGSTAIGLNLS